MAVGESEKNVIEECEGSSMTLRRVRVKESIHGAKRPWYRDYTGEEFSVDMSTQKFHEGTGEYIVTVIEYHGEDTTIRSKVVIGYKGLLVCDIEDIEDPVSDYDRAMSII